MCSNRVWYRTGLYVDYQFSCVHVGQSLGSVLTAYINFNTLLPIFMLVRHVRYVWTFPARYPIACNKNNQTKKHRQFSSTQPSRCRRLTSRCLPGTSHVHEYKLQRTERVFDAYQIYVFLYVYNTPKYGSLSGNFPYKY